MATTLRTRTEKADHATRLDIRRPPPAPAPAPIEVDRVARGGCPASRSRLRPARTTERPARTAGPRLPAHSSPTTRFVTGDPTSSVEHKGPTRRHSFDDLGSSTALSRPPCDSLPPPRLGTPPPTRTGTAGSGMVALGSHAMVRCSTRPLHSLASDTSNA